MAKLNSSYFSTWSHNMAYIFGLYYAVGYGHEENIINITLRTKDKYLIKQVAEELGYKRPLVDSKNQQLVQIKFSDANIYKDILALTQGIFSLIPDEYLGDFIRGYFDGSGEVNLIKGNRINMIFKGKSEDFLSSLLEVLQNYAGVESGSYDTSSMSLRFGKRDSIRIGEFMYKDNPELFLKRKRDKFT